MLQYQVIALAQVNFHHVILWSAFKIFSKSHLHRDLTAVHTDEPFLFQELFVSWVYSAELRA